jgi:hypothetical protein
LDASRKGTDKIRPVLYRGLRGQLLKVDNRHA